MGAIENTNKWQMTVWNEEAELLTNLRVEKKNIVGYRSERFYTLLLYFRQIKKWKSQ